jgi:hypothetical protein
MPDKVREKEREREGGRDSRKGSALKPMMVAAEQQANNSGLQGNANQFGLN